MFDFTSVTTPAATPSSSPQRVHWRLPAGILTTIRLRFPPGCMGLVGVRFRQGGLTLSPRTPSGWMIGDDEIIPQEVYVELLPGWNDVVIETYNSDTLYPHTITAGFTVLDKSIALPYVTLSSINSSLRRLLSRIGIV